MGRTTELRHTGARMPGQMKTRITVLVLLAAVLAATDVYLIDRMFSEKPPGARLEGHAFDSTSANGTLSTYDAIAAVVPLNAQAAYRALKPTLEQLDDAALYVYATDGSPIGPRLGVQDIEEPTLKALANYEWQRRAKAAADAATLKSAQARMRGDHWFQILMAVVSVILGFLLARIGATLDRRAAKREDE
jgi:hypothetical protein